jgi:hypothetical protein
MGTVKWYNSAKGFGFTSYLTAPGAGAKGGTEDENAFPFSTASWYFLDALDMMAPADARAIAAFGDSITDGTASTMNGDDRWPDVLARRLHAVYGNKVGSVERRPSAQSLRKTETCQGAAIRAGRVVGVRPK